MGKPVFVPVRKPFVESLGLRPDYWSRYTLCPKWGLLPGGIVEWTHRLSAMGARIAKEQSR